MSSEMREIQHDQHTHPGPRQYIIIGLILFVLTMVEYLLYLMEDRWNMLPQGPAAVLIIHQTGLDPTRSVRSRPRCSAMRDIAP